MFVLFPLDTYWGHKIHYTDCFSARISKGQRTVNMENGPFSLNGITHENSHCYFCNNCTTDNLQFYIIQSVTFHLFQVHMQNNFMWKLCLYCDLKYLVSRSTYSLGIAHTHFGKADSQLGELGIWQLFLKCIRYLSHTEVIFNKSITYSVCLLTIQQHLNYRKVVRSQFLLHSKEGEKNNIYIVNPNMHDLSLCGLSSRLYIPLPFLII